jgi:peroxiredoxin Q/BCP
VVEVGQPAPDFTLEDQNGREVTLSKLKGRPVVLYFYPQDDTPTCTTEACTFRDDHARYQKAGAKVIGISPDDSKSHKKFVDKFQLPFTLVADTDQEVCERYGVWQEKTLFGRTYMGVVRSTFIIDRDGIVRHVFSKVRVKGHSDAVLEAIKELKK